MKYKITKVCPECKGRKIRVCFDLEGTRTSDIKCENCNGTGKTSEIVEIENITGRITKKERYCNLQNQLKELMIKLYHTGSQIELSNKEIDRDIKKETQIYYITANEKERSK